jgi:uncharacterized protein (DUF983 family)
MDFAFAPPVSLELVIWLPIALWVSLVPLPRMKGGRDWVC